MIYLDRLRAAMVEAGYSSIAKAGKRVGIPPTTMRRKMLTGDFTMNEMDDMVEKFSIRHPEEIFAVGQRA